MTKGSLLGRAGRHDIDVGLGHGQPLDLQTLSCLYERSEVLLTDGYLTPVHVEQELLHMSGRHSVQVDDVMFVFVSVLGQEGPEVGRTD